MKLFSQQALLQLRARQPRLGSVQSVKGPRPTMWRDTGGYCARTPPPPNHAEGCGGIMCRERRSRRTNTWIRTVGGHVRGAIVPLVGIIVVRQRGLFDSWHLRGLGARHRRRINDLGRPCARIVARQPVSAGRRANQHRAARCPPNTHTSSTRGRQRKTATENKQEERRQQIKKKK